MVIPAPFPEDAGGEAVWIDVIRKMDTVYADLIESQTALEERTAKLQEAHDFIGSVLAAMNDVLAVCDRQGRVQRLNAAMLGAIGGTEGDWIGRPASDLFVPDDAVALLDHMEAARGSRHVPAFELQLAGSDPQRSQISVDIAVRRDGNGRLDGFVIVGRPIGELQSAYRELDKAHRSLVQTQQQLFVSEKMAALGRLVAGVAHELNNPISFVFGNMYALRRYGQALTSYLTAMDADTPREALDDLRAQLKIDRILSDIGPLVDGTLEGAERVRDIVQDLRRFSANQEESAESFDAGRLIATAADWVAKAQRTPPRITLQLPDPFDIIGRRGPLHQIMVNLIQNAADAIADVPDGEIVVRAQCQPDMNRIVVADNGPGIADDLRDKIFEPFFTTKPVGTGTGLGLYLSYNLALKMNGTLSIQPSDAGGASFILQWPNEPQAHG